MQSRWSPVTIVEGTDLKSLTFLCLECQKLCNKCVDVCPNRANVAVEVPGLRDRYQILHVHRLCNECGNCGTFCPYEGAPYRHKLTLFTDKEEWATAANEGFYLENDGGRAVLRVADSTVTLTAAPGMSGRAPQAFRRAAAVVEAVLSGHPALLGRSDP